MRRSMKLRSCFPGERIHAAAATAEAKFVAEHQLRVEVEKERDGANEKLKRALSTIDAANAQLNQLRSEVCRATSSRPGRDSSMTPP